MFVSGLTASADTSPRHPPRHHLLRGARVFDARLSQVCSANSTATVVFLPMYISSQILFLGRFLPGYLSLLTAEESRCSPCCCFLRWGVKGWWEGGRGGGVEVGKVFVTFFCTVLTLKGREGASAGVRNVSFLLFSFTLYLFCFVSLRESAPISSSSVSCRTG